MNKNVPMYPLVVYFVHYVKRFVRRGITSNITDQFWKCCFEFLAPVCIDYVVVCVILRACVSCLRAKFVFFSKSEWF